MRKIVLLIIFILNLTSGNTKTVPSPSIGQKIKVVTISGNTLIGNLESESDDQVSIDTDFGIISITREKIESMEIYSASNSSSNNAINKINNTEIVQPKINQEARWRTVYSSMLLGNGLYGIGVPFVLGIEDPKLYTASQLLMFGGGFYASYKYTENMHLPYGRWQFQSTGAGLGAASIIPLISVVGFENWSNFDESGKISIAYIMAMAPYGAIQADKKYKQWDLTNGQATIISSSVPWAVANAFGTLFLLYGDDWPESELANRANFISIYAAGIGAPFLANNYFSNKSLTEDDALFTIFSFGLGFINSVYVLSILDGSSVRGGALLLMSITNGFGYYASSMIEDVDLKKGDWRIIGLGTGAAFLIRTGIRVLISEDGGKVSQIIDMAALNAGWYFTFKKISTKKTKLSHFKKENKGAFLSLSPAIMNISNNIIPGMQIKAEFF